MLVYAWATISAVQCIRSGACNATTYAYAYSYAQYACAYSGWYIISLSAMSTALLSDCRKR
jgi:hypothetical protein